MRIIFRFLLIVVGATAYTQSILLKRTSEIMTESGFIEFGSERTVDDSTEGCLGAPFLYVTLHHETRNVLKYSRDGCLITDHVLFDEPRAAMNFRSMALNRNGELYIANAADDNNQILLFGSCSQNSSTMQNTKAMTNRTASDISLHDLGAEQINAGRRQFKGVVVDIKANRGAEHPYGIALDADQAKARRTSLRLQKPIFCILLERGKGLQGKRRDPTATNADYSRDI